ncbi:MAG TPA: P27 family phage terminase small subunit, partial [Clostridia bacterium]|nr:P27 family phage terminase small subunit [Clostridia bacterium]
IAHAHWMEIKRKIKGINLLDDVDCDMLGIYCHLLARRERILFPNPDDKIEDNDVDAIVTAMLKVHVDYMMTLERLIAQYAEKLGLTPGGRARLAKREAEKPRENKFSKFQK